MGYSKYARWDSHKTCRGIPQERDTFHRGLHELGEVLGLQFTQEYRVYRTSDIDERGLRVYGPFLEIRGRKVGNEWVDPIFKVRDHVRNEVDTEPNEETWPFESPEEIPIGVWTNDTLFRIGYKVLEILEEKHYPDRPKPTDPWEEGFGNHIYTVSIQSAYPVFGN